MKSMFPKGKQVIALHKHIIKNNIVQNDKYKGKEGFIPNTYVAWDQE